MSIKLKINGTMSEVEAAPGTPLLWVLRDTLRLTGTKFGCGVAACGACTVHLDGMPVRSCQTMIEDVGDSEVTTIEQVGGEVAEAVRQAWRELDVVQCGYCQSGQIMQAVGLLTETRSPSVEEIDAQMWGNACRCATYQRIRGAILRAAEILEA
ncbi:(2Fe-2S)-binding protein [Salipiger sp. P9]|uniref:(2Fe-2S)-binding protein n=1 Tax=Salipiger pentaromativorans TaxID=2943193 RepID=UPI00215752F6|nr:(2Fe-2S)-binding protein [Salipiger pentaromativorans]MCR8550642.1 (2Fe-2S)-binding protein [Salipiger pentaromativorans]